jgi:hypothetical protein
MLWSGSDELTGSNVLAARELLVVASSSMAASSFATTAWDAEEEIKGMQIIKVL